MQSTIINLAFLICSIIAQEMGRAVLVAHIYGRRNIHTHEPSSNPLHYIDILGTLILPAISMTSGIFIGYAKSIFVDPLGTGLSKPERLLLAAGRIITSLFIASVFFILLIISTKTGSMYAMAPLFAVIVKMNLALMLFMSIPLPGFDGFRILMSFQNRSNALKMIDFETRPSSLIFSLLAVILFLGSFLSYFLSIITAYLQSFIDKV